eukprot:1157224-Pelagomonas_calceolata.AAC.9
MWPGEKARTGASWPAPKRQTPVEALAVRQHFSGETTTGGADHHRSAICAAYKIKQGKRGRTHDELGDSQIKQAEKRHAGQGGRPEKEFCALTKQDRARSMAQLCSIHFCSKSCHPHWITKVQEHVGAKKTYGRAAGTGCSVQIKKPEFSNPTSKGAISAQPR